MFSYYNIHCAALLKWPYWAQKKKWQASHDFCLRYNISARMAYQVWHGMVDVEWYVRHGMVCLVWYGFVSLVWYARYGRHVVMVGGQWWDYHLQPFHWIVRPGSNGNFGTGCGLPSSSPHCDCTSAVAKLGYAERCYKMCALSVYIWPQALWCGANEEVALR